MAHALLSPSSAERWLHCTPSARAEEPYPDKESVYTEEGTLAHRLAEITLKNYLGEYTEKEYQKELALCRASPSYYPDMEEEVEEYTRFCMDEKSKQSKWGTARVEERISLDTYVTDSFGTADFLLIDRGTLHVIDLKFGKGKVVNPFENPQLKLYALGAYDAWGFIYEIEKVHCTIAQVRLGEINTYTLPLSDLLSWGEEIKPIAKKAYLGAGEKKAGSWCQFCKLKVTCKARAAYLLDGMDEKKNADTLSEKEIATLLPRLDSLTSWIKDLSDYALQKALQGTTYPGFKVVEGRSNRKIKDADAFSKRLLMAGYEEGRIYKPRELEGITNLTRYLGKKKFSELSEGLIEKPPGKPVLVPEDDKRLSIFDAANDFTFTEKED